MRSAICLSFLAIATTACGTEVKPTRALVEVYSNFGEDLARLKVEARDEDDPERRKNEVIPLAGKRVSDPNKPDFLLSFAIAPSPGGDQHTFRVEVVGLDKDDNELVRGRAVSRFARGTYVNVPVHLMRLCAGVECPDPNETCSDKILDAQGKGQCVPLGSEDDVTTDGAQVLDASVDARVMDATSADAKGVREAAMDDGETASCNEDGALRCATSGGMLRQRCERGVWVEAGPCAENEVCDKSAAVPGTCRELLDVCRGSGGQAVCDGAVMQLCSADGVAESTEECKSPSHCQKGIQGRKCYACLPGEFRCDGAKLEVCADDGSGFEMHMMCGSASLCNSALGACKDAPCVAGSKTCVGDSLQVCNAEQTAFTEDTKCDPGLCDPVAKECDLCAPGARTCDGNTVVTCNADGQDHTRAPCAAPKSVCTGSGVCVQCTSATSCPAPASECQAASCDVANGTCGTAPLADHTDCRIAGATGVCRGGTCVGCIDSSDCRRLTPATPTCNAGACVACAVDADCSGRVTVDTCHEPACVSNGCTTRIKAGASCGSGRVCNASTGVCEASCGNGRVDTGEECDPNAAGSDNWSCNSQTCKTTRLSGATSYHTCASATDCSDGETCKGTAILIGWQLCIPTCSNGFCPIPPGYTEKVVRIDTDDAFCSTMLDDCFVSCEMDPDCPPGTICAGGVCRAEFL